MSECAALVRRVKDAVTAYEERRYTSRQARDMFASFSREARTLRDNGGCDRETMQELVVICNDIWLWEAKVVNGHSLSRGVGFFAVFVCTIGVVEWMWG